ncbi:MAG: phosphoribosylformylglycinamidine cyclo-ligase [Tissierellia bacterium]|nr:phosphoribosylformylglycinamidine cyclo-ligase [Tissierellia bacterium]
MGMTYRDAGVDKEAGYKQVKLIKDVVKSTFTPGVISELGGFAGLFAPDLTGYEEPVLVSGTDGVGSKLKLAFLTDIHNTIGQDCVAMCVNDILCQGAQPLFFLDYIATDKLIPEKMAAIVEGVATGCKLSGAALIGGETAEMPGFYSEGEYDVAGFAVGIVDRKKIIDGSKIIAGDVLIGLPSSGVHSNGFSLVRKIVFERMNMKVDDKVEGLSKTLGEELLTPTKIYVKAVLPLVKENLINGMCHITGGGFFENIPRMMPKGLGAKLDISSIKTPEIFKLLQKWGNIENNEMYGTFNMGIGMVLAVSAGNEIKCLDMLKEAGEQPIILGNVEDGEGVKL